MFYSVCNEEWKRERAKRPNLENFPLWSEITIPEIYVVRLLSMIHFCGQQFEMFNKFDRAVAQKISILITRSEIKTKIWFFFR